MFMSPPVLTIIVPVKDEEEAIAPFVERVTRTVQGIDDAAAASFEILFVDDGSTDGTLDQIRRAHAAHSHVRAVSFSRNFGKESALSAGLDHARGQAVVPLDVDLQPTACPSG
jgi:glycosyltransferase involved in cell wall biosynthesis